MNVKQIIEAWIISFNPTSQQRELAEIRGKVCDECPSKIMVINMATCKECGCPIGKKIFTNDFNPIFKCYI
jgi:hypothetical protein